ncbi:Hypothetical predicted protein [Octopus vulgaris]|uniref:Uncharacterized protein n=1 Tax=Octopus vulgaris TaxID=6645 RepID=A0AA36FAG6_OCTVU|nr:Hypothetical predicted protein [Octopus vulgaris]
MSSKANCNYDITCDKRLASANSSYYDRLQKANLLNVAASDSRSSRHSKFVLNEQSEEYKHFKVVLNEMSLEKINSFLKQPLQDFLNIALMYTVRAF